LILSAQFSHNGEYLAISSDDKHVTVFNSESNGKYTEVGRISAKKKAGCMTFNRENDTLFIGDKFGEVWSVNLNQFKSEKFVKEPKLELGHVSLLTDLV
jgi:WD40 repeat protein